MLELALRFLFESTLSFRLSGDFERDFDDAESLESERDLLDLLRSTLFDLDFLVRIGDFERDFLDLEIGDLDLDLLDFERSWDLDLDLLVFDFDRDLLVLDLERDRRDFDAGDRDLLDFGIGDFDLDFLDLPTGDLEGDFLESFSGSSGEGERLFFFFPSAMLINFACSRDIATAASLPEQIMSDKNFWNKKLHRESLVFKFKVR